MMYLSNTLTKLANLYRIGGIKVKYVLTCNCGSQDFEYERGLADVYICTQCGTVVNSMSDDDEAGFLKACPE